MPVVLIVEDEVPFRSVIRAALTRDGYIVVEADEGKTAATMLKTQPIDLVVTDILMPEMDGLDFLMELRAEKNSVPIIAMTGGHPNTDLYLRIATALGAERVLCKPFRTDQLLTMVRRVLLESPVKH
jgi:CheY-like chemotaxis protein